MRAEATHVLILHGDDVDQYWAAGEGRTADAALDCLRLQLEVNRAYEGDEEATARARQIVADADGQEAWRFLQTRLDYEYERVELAQLRRPI